MIQVFWFIVFANSALLAILCRVKLLEALRAIGWLLPLMVWIISSVYWSAYPDLTIRRAAREELELICIVLLMCTYSRPTEPLRIIFLSFVTILLFDLASLAFPSFSFSSNPTGFRGIHGQKNVAGEFYFLALPLFILAIFDRTIAVGRRTAMLASICAAPLLLLSNSKTAIGLFAVTSFCLIAARAFRRMGEYTAVLALIYFLIGAIAAIIVFAAGLADTVASLTGDATLTGRTTVWRYVLSRWEESPYVGQGYGALWSVGPQSEANLRAGQLNWTMNEAHNGYLDVLAQTGIIGVLFLGIFLCAALPTVLFARESNTLNAWKYYGTYVMIGVVLVNITESTLVKAGAGDWLLFVATFATVGLSRRPANFPQTPVGKTGSSLISVSA